MLRRRLKPLRSLYASVNSPPREIAVGFRGVSIHPTQDDDNALFSIGLNDHAGHPVIRKIDTYHGGRVVELGWATESPEDDDLLDHHLTPSGHERLAEMLALHVPSKQMKISTISDLADLVDNAAERTEWRGVTIHPPEHMRKQMSDAVLPIHLGRTALRAARDGSWAMAINHAKHAADTERHHTGSWTVWGPVFEAFKSMAPPD